MLDLMSFHHIGVAVKSIEATSGVYEEAGYVKSEVVFDPVQHVNICWLSKPGMPLIELLEPVGVMSPVNKVLEKNGVCPYHICYLVDDIEESVKMLRKKKYIVVCNPVEAPAIHHSKVAFLFNKHVGLIELVESPARIKVEL